MKENGIWIRTKGITFHWGQEQEKKKHFTKDKNKKKTFHYRQIQELKEQHFTEDKNKNKQNNVPTDKNENKRASENLW